jgi:hypothetical protein
MFWFPEKLCFPKEMFEGHFLVLGDESEKLEDYWKPLEWLEIQQVD